MLHPPRNLGPHLRLEDVFWRRKAKANIFVLIRTSWRRLQDAFWRRRRKTSSRRLQDVFIKTNVCWDTNSPCNLRIQTCGFVSHRFMIYLQNTNALNIFTWENIRQRAHSVVNTIWYSSLNGRWTLLKHDIFLEQIIAN